MSTFKLRSVLCGALSVTVLTLTGCGPTQTINPWALRKENTQLKTALRQSQDQLAQAKLRADDLDEDNEALQTQLAEAQQSGQRARTDKKGLSIGSVPGPRREADEYDPDPKEYGPAGGRGAGSARGAAKPVILSKSGRGGDGISATSIPGTDVLRDGDKIRIRVTNTNLFDPGKATLKPGATQVLDRVTASLRRDYPGQLIGIEGHTDADPIKKSNWKDNHELSVERAKAVYEYLRTKGGITADQLYVAGYGANVPVASNKSASGKAQNRRVEFVVHPTGARASNDRASRQ